MRGGGCYSLQHSDRQVWLNELNADVFTLWDYLIRTDPNEVITRVPRVVKKGDNAIDLAGSGAAPGLLMLIKANVNMGTLGSRGNHTVVTQFAEIKWHQVHPRLERFLPRIRHWKITNLDYVSLPNEKATWFVDPPYSGDAGRRYALNRVDFSSLGDWCRGRNGQTIVCENAGANWLPFGDLVAGMPRGGVRRQMEAIWTQDRLA